MNIEQIRELCLSLKGVTEDMPFGDDIVTFRLEGKIFVCLWLGVDNPRFAIKLTPERNEELRESNSSIVPAYHWNKKHWSDVAYEEIEENLTERLIRESYQVIVKKLPKALRTKYESDKH